MLKKILLPFVFILILINVSYSQDKGTGFYSQLIGFKGGGEFFVNSFQSDWSTGVFFENVINPWLGLEIEMVRSSIPITNYGEVYNIAGVATTNLFIGKGQRNYIELSGALKFYIKGVSICAGLSYNQFLNGYIVYNTNTVTYAYQQMSDKENNFFAFFAGPELTAQISSDLFAKVGVRAIYGLIQETPNYTFGARFYIAFAYGM